jgi:hypothetical protein
MMKFEYGRNFEKFPFNFFMTLPQKKSFKETIIKILAENKYQFQILENYQLLNLKTT